jgi:hypothetical protein
MRCTLIAAIVTTVIVCPAHAQMIQSGPAAGSAPLPEQTRPADTSQQLTPGQIYIPGSKTPSTSLNNLSNPSPSTSRDMPARPEGPLR